MLPADVSPGGQHGAQSPLRVVIVGSGFMGQVHARAARRAGARIVAVVTRGGSPDIAHALGAEAAVSSVEDAVALDPDVVHICTPNAAHPDQVRTVLAAGHHVICEKPLATTAAEAADLARAATGVVATVPFAYRYYGTVREMRSRLSAGAPVLQIRGAYLQDWLAAAGSTNWRVDPVLGGASRAFADIGIHWCDLAEFVTGHRITRLVATTRITSPLRGDVPARTEDLVALLFQTDRGAAGVMTASQVALGRKNQLRLDVDGAAAAYSFEQESPETLWSATPEGVTLSARGTSTDPLVRRYDRTPAGHPQGYQDCFDAFVADTYAAVRGEPAPDGLPTFADGARAAVLTEAVLTSAATGGWVDVPPGPAAPPTPPSRSPA